MNKRIMRILLFALICASFLTGCTSKEPEAEITEEDITVKSTYVAPMANSLDEAIIMNVDTDESTIQLYNLALGRSYTLNYNTATGMKNRFSDELVAGQLMPGDMARVTFIREDKLLKTLQIMSEVNVYSDVKDFQLNSVSRTMSFAGEQYKVSKNAMVLSSGNLLDLNEVHDVDALKVVERNHEILGITIEKGHGYVRLIGQDAFIDGFVEVGQAAIKKVTKEMLIVVPEGEYTLFISKDGISGSQEITINPGEETLVDVSEFEITDEKKMGKIIFTISPSSAKLYIDGKETDYDEPVELTCGIHQVKVTAKGYKSLTQYIKVGQATANFNIELEEGKEEDDSESNDGYYNTPSLSSNAISVTGESEFRVYIDSPIGAEMYVDGSYIGVIPTNFAKKEGTFVVSLRKDGYQTRSYTLLIDSTNKDVRYSFSDLTPK